MTEANIIAQVLDILENHGIRAVYEFVRLHADRLGIPLPDGWTPTAKREEMEKVADDGGWPK